MNKAISEMDAELRNAIQLLGNASYGKQLEELRNALTINVISIPDMRSSIDELNRVMKATVSFPPEFYESYQKSFQAMSNVLKDISLSFKNVSLGIDNVNKLRVITDGVNKISINNSRDVILLKKMITDITFDECADFLNYISNYPMLSFKHKIGKEIFEIVADSKYEEINEIEMHRVRKHEYGKRIPYTDNEMFESPYAVSSQQRFSSNGQNYLYTSDKLKTAIVEVCIEEGDTYTWIKLILITKLKMLDIRNSKIPLFEYCNYPAPKEKKQLTTEYLLPNYVADCAKYNNCDGIIYNSVRVENSINYVFFKAGRSNFGIISRGNN
jgi:hypothetical protein